MHLKTITLGSPRQVGFGLLLAIAVAAGGCGTPIDPPKGRVEVFPAKGTVTRKGQPLAGALVRFQTADQKHGASATTDDAGNFTATTYSANDGLPAGELAVSVLLPEATSPTTTSSGSIDAGDYQPPVPVTAKAPAKPKATGLPAKYADFSQSGLKVTIPAGGAKEPLKIDLSE